MALDPKAVRRYNATIERSLALFDANSEWADHIAFLSRLLKSIETGRPENLHDIPAKAKIATCLSRCLQPALPSGVHQRALDVYTEIFSIIGKDGLSRDLSLYLSGISHTLAFANLSTRPVILDIYEGHILKLEPNTLRPALKSIILSLLPVIEEETSEDFERCLQTFDALRRLFAVDGQEYFFWQTLFTASISNSQRRSGVLIYLNRYLPRLYSSSTTVKQGDPAAVVLTPEPGLLVRCFATGLRDEQALTQRGFLDLLVTNLPLNADILQQDAYRKDLDVLVSAALVIVLRRDMSLNRRLWAWLSGSGSSLDAVQVTSPVTPAENNMKLDNMYFTSYGLPPIIRSVQTLIEDSETSPTSRSLPFRIMLSLMDRWDIGGPIVKSLFSVIMNNLLIYQSSAPSQAAFDEVFRSANVFFDAIESSSLFDSIDLLIKDGEIELVSFIVGNFNIDQADPTQLHIIRLADQVANLIHPEEEKRILLATLLNDLTAQLSAASLAKEAQSVASHKLLLSTATVTRLTFNSMNDRSLLSSVCSSFERLLILSKDPDVTVLQGIVQILRSLFSENHLDFDRFALIDPSARLLSTILRCTVDTTDDVSHSALDCLPSVIQSLWQLLDTRSPQYHVAVVDHFCQLAEITSKDCIIESEILNLIARTQHSSAASYQRQIERFGTLFHHVRLTKRASDDFVLAILRRPSLRILDECLGEDRSEPGIRWLTNLNSVSPIVKFILDTSLERFQDQVLALARTQKLLRVLYVSDDHWRAFSRSSDLQLVHGFCLRLINSHEGKDLTLSSEGFAILRMLYGARSGNIPPEEFINLLIERLDQQNFETGAQEEVLDTLLAILNERTSLPSLLVKVLLSGLPSIAADDRLDKWITLLCNFLPNHAAFLPSLLKVTNGFCKRIEAIFGNLSTIFSEPGKVSNAHDPEKAIANLLAGLEYVLARAHQQVFNNVMPNGQATSSSNQEPISSRSKANDRLTVILCMQDAIRVCTKLWAWRSVALVLPSEDIKSFQYTATKIRTRSRKILENLIEAEPQECLETLLGLWVSEEKASVLDLLQTLNGARPSSMLPATFNAVYNRSNPGALSSAQQSSLSIQINAIQLIDFLNEYTSALEDDMLEEIWADCAAFLREVLGNPMPHRQILTKLLRFCSMLARKMENTNFSEDTRMSRELADICTRLFTAIFTIKPAGFDGTSIPNGTSDKLIGHEGIKVPPASEESMLSVLTDVLPHLGPLLAQYDRTNTVYAGIATNIMTPAFHARTFPQNLSLEHLRAVRLISPSSKSWKKDTIDALNNPKLFRSSEELSTAGWLPLLRQLLISDKTVLPECLNRLVPPAAAGLLGIGASAARTEADRKTQLELRRIATLLLAGEQDAALTHLPLVTQKIEELLSATVESSPSLASRADLYLLLRALLMQTSHSYLTHIWPLIDGELREVCLDVLAGSESRYTAASKLQGAKLLDVLLLMRPDEFQLHEWLFVTDTIDAVYPATGALSSAYGDEIGRFMQSNSEHIDLESANKQRLRRPWLIGKCSTDANEVNRLLAGFFGQLSIRAFEGLYSLKPVDEGACKQDLVADIFSDTAS